MEPATGQAPTKARSLLEQHELAKEQYKLEMVERTGTSAVDFFSH